MQRNYKRFAVHSIQKFITYLSIIHVILFNPHTFGHGFLTQFTHFSAPVAQLSRAKTGATVATWVSPSVHFVVRAYITKDGMLIDVDIFKKDSSIPYPVGVVVESQHSLFLNHLHGMRKPLSLPLLLCCSHDRPQRSPPETLETGGEGDDDCDCTGGTIRGPLGPERKAQSYDDESRTPNTVTLLCVGFPVLQFLHASCLCHHYMFFFFLHLWW